MPLSLFRDPRRSFSTCRSPSLGCGNWSWPWCSSAIVRPAAWSNRCTTSSIFRISLGTVHNIVHTAVAHARRINQQYGLSSIFRISLGTVHNIVHSAVAHARRINQQYDLSSILIGLLDEIFQAGDPVLVGVDATSTFCFLLSLEQHRDANTWGVRLLELVDQGFAPKATIADFGSGLRAGHQQALPEVPCRGDVFQVVHTGRWSVTWRTGLTKPWTPGPSSSESKLPRNVVLPQGPESGQEAIVRTAG